jgi:phosphoglycerate dehydrogenase-like enzyme
MARAASKSSQRPRVHVTHSDSIVDSQLVTPARIRATAKKFPGLLSRVEFVYGDDPASLETSLPKTDVLLLSGNIDLSRLKARAPKLRWIQSCSAGVEKLAPLIPADVTLTNASGVHGPRGGEYGMTAVLMLNSRVPSFVTNQQAARWEQIHTTPLKGKTLVLLGVGAIGGEVARLAKRYGMRVLGVTRSGKPHKSVDRMFRPKQFAQVLPKADFVLSTLPLTPETNSLVGRAELDMLPRHAGVVNLGRGRVIDYDALMQKLHKRELSGAVLDVFYEEPLPADSPLWSTPNLIMSPHCAVDDESVYVERCLDIFFDNLKRFLGGRPLNNVVDTRVGY